VFHCIAAARGSNEPSAKLYVGNLPCNTTELDLMKIFDGSVKARIVHHGRGSRG